MNHKEYRGILKIVGLNHQPIALNIKAGRWITGIKQLVDSTTFTIDNKSNLPANSVQPRDELVLTRVEVTSGKREDVLFGFIDKVTNAFEKDRNTGSLIKNEIIIEARSLPSILTWNTIEGNFVFKKGYGELVSKLGKKYGFDVTNVKLNSRKGTIYLKRMPVLEAIRRMAYLQHWCFFFEGRKMFFEPWKPAPPSGLTITDDDMLSGSFSRG